MDAAWARQANTLERLFKSTVISDVNGVKEEIANLRRDIPRLKLQQMERYGLVADDES